MLFTVVSYVLVFDLNGRETDFISMWTIIVEEIFSNRIVICPPYNHFVFCVYHMSHMH